MGIRSRYSSAESGSAALEAMKAVANASRDRSLELFESALLKHKQQLADDIIIQSHVSEMYETMLQKNLCRIVEAYSSIEISQVAKLIKLPQPVVEAKLSKMILDKKLDGERRSLAAAQLPCCVCLRARMSSRV